MPQNIQTTDDVVLADLTDEELVEQMFDDLKCLYVPI
jgi:hypothetical protein